METRDSSKSGVKSMETKDSSKLGIIHGLRLSFKFKNRRHSDVTSERKDKSCEKERKHSVDDNELSVNQGKHDRNNVKDRKMSVDDNELSVNQGKCEILNPEDSFALCSTSTMKKFNPQESFAPCSTSTMKRTNSGSDVVTARERFSLSSSAKHASKKNVFAAKDTFSLSSSREGKFENEDESDDVFASETNFTSDDVFAPSPDKVFASKSKKTKTSNDSSKDRLTKDTFSLASSGEYPSGSDFTSSSVEAFPSKSKSTSSMISMDSGFFPSIAAPSRRLSMGSNTSLKRTPAFSLKRRPSDIRILHKFHSANEISEKDGVTSVKQITPIRRVPATNPYIRAGSTLSALSSNYDLLMKKDPIPPIRAGSTLPALSSNYELLMKKEPALSALSSNYELLMRKEPTPPIQRKKVPQTSTRRPRMSTQIKFTVDLSDSIHC